MPKFKKETIFFRKADGERIHETFDIHISAEGLFYTNVPENVESTLKEMGINLTYNRHTNRKSLVEEVTFSKLTTELKRLLEEAHSAELIESIIVIRYRIDTVCSYAVHDGEIHPNGGDITGDKTDWKQGTTKGNILDSGPYSFSIAAEFKNKVTYKYRSGKTFTKYHAVLAYNADKELSKKYMEIPSFRFIECLNGMQVSHRDFNEVPFDIDLCNMLCSMIKSLCQLNEKIKPIITDPDKMLEASKKGIKLLS